MLDVIWRRSPGASRGSASPAADAGRVPPPPPDDQRPRAVLGRRQPRPRSRRGSRHRPDARCRGRVPANGADVPPVPGVAGGRVGSGGGSGAGSRAAGRRGEAGSRREPGRRSGRDHGQQAVHRAVTGRAARGQQSERYLSTNLSGARRFGRPAEVPVPMWRPLLKTGRPFLKNAHPLKLRTRTCAMTQLRCGPFRQEQLSTSAAGIDWVPDALHAARSIPARFSTLLQRVVGPCTPSSGGAAFDQPGRDPDGGSATLRSERGIESRTETLMEHFDAT